MKIASKINPRNLFRSKKNRSVSRSDPSSFGSYATTTSSDSPEPSHRNSKSSDGVATPTSVLLRVRSRSREISTSGDYWPEISTDVQLELAQAFRFIDRDGDGRITTEELEAVLSRIGGGPEELSLMVSEVDRDGDGIVTLEEFGAVVGSAFAPAAACDTELRDVFEFFDGDRDGRITAEELLAALDSIGGGERGCTLEECRSMISSVDLKGDGFVCFEDFSRMMEQQQQQR